MVSFGKTATSVLTPFLTSETTTTTFFMRIGLSKSKSTRGPSGMSRSNSCLGGGIFVFSCTFFLRSMPLGVGGSSTGNSSPSGDTTTT